MILWGEEWMMPLDMCRLVADRFFESEVFIESRILVS